MCSFQILDSAIKAFEKMLEAPLQKQRKRRRKRIFETQQETHSWYKNEKYPKIVFKSVLFVFPNPRGNLAKELKLREEELNKFSSERIKLVEKGGLKIENILSQTNPLKKERCLIQLCPLCANQSKDVKTLFNTNKVGYRRICKNLCGTK